MDSRNTAYILTSQFKMASGCKNAEVF